ncbi:MAG: alanine--tRNA ligase [Candidatus Yanofskybacteria bacterium]|nr:alanine--tRNA ligase [Candidatus Yanofskybacteria bacterium]
MTHLEIRKKFLKFFEDRGHKIVPSSSLLPNDPSVLFTTAGMQQFKPYYTGEADPMKDFGSLNAASIQKCIRTSDIDEVGDESHLTFFEMLGNFSFGGYWKKEAIEYAHEFITKEMGLEIDYISVFGGADTHEIFELKKIKADPVPTDKDSEQIWKKIDPNIKIEARKGINGLRDNFWGPTGDEGPCGPTTEIYVKGVEIWNIVFNEYNCTKDFKFEPLKKRGVDTGMGLERLAMAVQNKKNIFETDLFAFGNGLPRIIADHARAVVFLISDGVLPSNKDQGYVLRRLIRRIIVKRNDTANLYEILNSVIHEYKYFYANLDENKIREVFKEEAEKFWKTMSRGLAELNKLEIVDLLAAFKLYESYGLPYESIKDSGKAKNLTREAFDEEFKKHQAKSRAGAEKKFGGHGLILDTGELKAGSEEELAKVTRLHTATHLLHASLRKVLGEEVHQAGSDITPERLRFDFTFPRKMTSEDIKQVEEIVNKAIDQDLPVTTREMPYEEALKKGALAFFKLKYPPIVKVYTIGSDDKPFSRELCGGPHVAHTGEIGKFKIKKEESISAGTRRIRADIS